MPSPTGPFTQTAELTNAPLNSTAGGTYRVFMDYALFSSYANGVPWAMLLGTTTFLTGQGAYSGWLPYYYTFTCGPTDASNVLTFKVTANNNRAGTFNIDNVFVFPISAV